MKIADSLHSEVVTGALRNALKTGYIAGGAIFHSDLGCQYTASSTRDLLHKHELLQSMSAAGYCYDNAFAESAFASLKAERPDAVLPFPSKQAARLAIFDEIETFFNRRRRHTSLGSISPFDYLKIHFTTHNKNLNEPALNLSTFSGDFHPSVAPPPAHFHSPSGTHLAASCQSA